MNREVMVCSCDEVGHARKRDRRQKVVKLDIYKTVSTDRDVKV